MVSANLLQSKAAAKGSKPSTSKAGPKTMAAGITKKEPTRAESRKISATSRELRERKVIIEAHEKAGRLGMVRSWKKRAAHTEERLRAAQVAAGMIPDSPEYAHLLEASTTAPSPAVMKGDGAASKGKSTPISPGSRSSVKKPKPNTMAPARHSTAGMAASSTSGKKRKADDSISRPSQKKSKLTVDHDGSASSPDRKVAMGADKPRQYINGARQSLKTRSGSGSCSGNAARSTRKNPSRTNSAGVAKCNRMLAHEKSGFRGLYNHHHACFSNSLIQFLDAALAGGKANDVLGPPATVEDFGTPTSTLNKFDYHDHLGLDKGISTKEKMFRREIVAAAKRGETEKLNPAKHLRALLSKMRKAGDVVSPYLFQAVFALGQTEDRLRGSKYLSPRQHLSGDTQEDAFEYYGALMDELKENATGAERTAFEKVFEFKTTKKQCCSKCGFESDPREDPPATYCDIGPTANAAGSQSLASLFQDSLTSELSDQSCPSCKDSKLVSKTGYKELPDSVVIRINRATADGKIYSEIDYTSKTLDIGGVSHDMVAMIMHQGESLARGHYSIFRKSTKGAWWLLSDKQTPEEVSAAQVRDASPKCSGGHSAMLLFKATS